MLNHLHISNFAIVPTLELDFRAGFTAITGETGAGKSIMVDALGLLLGDRSDATWVRPGAARAELSAEFSVEYNAPAREWLTASDLIVGDHCILRRTIDASGRSRAFINGSPVTVAQMQALGQLLVELHGQNQHLKLVRSSAQFRLLDDSGSYQKELTAVGSAYNAWKKTRDALQALEQESTVSATELAFLEFQLDELNQHDLSREAMEDLKMEHDRLAAGDTLLEALNTVVELMQPENDSGNRGINSNLITALGWLRTYVTLDTDIGEACQMLEEASVNCGEAISSLRAARDRLDPDPVRLEQLDALLGQLNALARKHRVTMNGLGDTRERLAARIQRAGHCGQLRTELETELDKQLEIYREAARRLHRERGAHAQELSRRVSGLMAELGMSGGVFRLVPGLDQSGNPSALGDDVLSITLSANPGVAPGPLQKIASGGELSRISLAIKVACISKNESVTQIFDEVDAGIGGQTAHAVGRMLQRLANGSQVLCVTHLAQVAVCATHQIRVSKASAKSSTLVDTHLLDDHGRVEEIARMLSGRPSEKSRAHALELLSSAHREPS